MTVNEVLMIAACRYIIIATVLTLVGLALVDLIWWIE